MSRPDTIEWCSTTDGDDRSRTTQDPDRHLARASATDRGRVLTNINGRRATLVADVEDGPDRLAAVRSRIEELDAAFGDPWQGDNPVGFVAITAADDARELPAAGVALYRELGINRIFVPKTLGGQLGGLDMLGPSLRPLFRRDASLAVSGALTSFMAGALTWLTGDREQCELMADVLLDGGTATVAFQRFDHGNEFVRDEYRVSRDDEDGYEFSGTKLAINNAATTDLLVAYAATDDGGYSMFMFDPDAVVGDTVRRLPRQETTGARGLQISGLEFGASHLPEDTLLGEWGAGVEFGLRAFPVIHASVPGMVIGIGDTALRTATKFALGKDRSVLDMPRARAALAGTFADLLISDCLSLTAARSVHLLPDQCDVLCAVVKYVVPKFVGETNYHLSVVLGDAFHARTGNNALFHKLVRDLATVTFGHVSTAVCQATIAPYLTLLADERIDIAYAAQADLFRMDRPVPDFDAERLARFGGSDGLAAYLIHAAATLPTTLADPTEAVVLAGQLAALTSALGELRIACHDLEKDGRFTTSPKVFPLTDRYALLLAAASCLGVWANAEGLDDEFIADPAWLLLALSRLLRRLGLRSPALPDRVEQAVCEETLARAATPRSFDLLGVALAG